MLHRLDCPFFTTVNQCDLQIQHI